MMRLERYVLVSLGVHALLLALFILGATFFSPKALVFLPSVQVDLVALPSQSKSEANPVVDQALPIKNKEAPEPQTAPPEEVKEEMAAPKTKAKPPKLAKKKNPEAEAESAIQKLRQEVEQAKEKKRAELHKFQDQYRAANRGNQLHEGTNTSGSMQATMNAYAAHVTERLRSQWSLPSWLQSTAFRAVVIIYIDAKGSLVSFKFTRASGNDAFDDYVKAAVQNSSPFAPPPSEMAKALRNGGMEVMFPL